MCINTPLTSRFVEPETVLKVDLAKFCNILDLSSAIKSIAFAIHFLMFFPITSSEVVNNLSFKALITLKAIFFTVLPIFLSEIFKILFFKLCNSCLLSVSSAVVKSKPPSIIPFNSVRSRTLWTLFSTFPPKSAANSFILSPFFSNVDLMLLLIDLTRELTCLLFFAKKLNELSLIELITLPAKTGISIFPKDNALIVQKKFL